MEGKKIKKNDKYEVKQILVMIISLLISITIAFPFMNWRHEPTGELRDYHLQNVSIFMLRRDPPPEGLWYTVRETQPFLAFYRGHAVCRGTRPGENLQ